MYTKNNEHKMLNVHDNGRALFCLPCGGKRNI